MESIVDHKADTEIIFSSETDVIVNSVPNVWKNTKPNTLKTSVKSNIKSINSVKAGPKNKQNIVTKQVTEQVAEQADEQFIKKVTEQAAEQVDEQVIKNVTEQAAEQAAEQATEQGTEQAAEQTTEQVAEQVTEPATKQVIQPVIKKSQFTQINQRVLSAISSEDNAQFCPDEYVVSFRNTLIKIESHYSKSRAVFVRCLCGRKMLHKTIICSNHLQYEGGCRKNGFGCPFEHPDQIQGIASTWRKFKLVETEVHKAYVEAMKLRESN